MIIILLKLRFLCNIINSINNVSYQILVNFFFLPFPTEFSEGKLVLGHFGDIVPN